MSEKIKVEIGNFYGYLFKPEAGTYKGCIVVLTDIFGVDQPPVQARCTELAEEGYLVFLPDCFDKNPITHEEIQANGMPFMQNWMKSHEPQGQFIQTVVADAVTYVQKQFGFTSKNTFLVGICIGAKILLKGVVTKPLVGNLAGGIITHGSMMSPAEFAAIDIPMIVLWAEKDTHFDYKPFVEEIDKITKEKENAGEKFCGGNYQYFLLKDAPHGFWVNAAEPQNFQVEANEKILKFLTQFSSN